MSQSTYERLIERDLREKTNNPRITIPQYILECEQADLTEREAAHRLGVPIPTYRRWRAKHLVVKVEKRCHLRVPAAAGLR